MLHKYSNLYFPICSLVTALFLTILFWSRKNVKNKETELYANILNLTLIEAIFTLGLTSSVHLYFNESTYGIFAIANKILYIIYMTWLSLLFMYFVRISYDTEKEIKVFKIITYLINFVFFICIIFSPIELIYDSVNKVSNSYGMSSIFLFISCAIYLFLMIVISLIDLRFKKELKKYIPLLVLILLMIIALTIRIVDPYCNLLSNILSLIALIMYNTIENPDIKMVKKLELAMVQAETASRAKSDFLSSMSHEIRTPLNAIVGLSEDMRKYDNVPKEVLEDAEDIQKASKDLLEIVSNILDVNKLDTNILELKNDNYNIRNEIEEVVKVFIDRIKEKNINFSVYYTNNVPYELIGDKDNIKIIVKNLLSNAVKYTEVGTININVDWQDERLNIIISDTGKGIKEEDITKLFSRFERLDVEINSTISGTGLGLPLTKSLVDIMAGEISVESTYDKGSTFKVSIPQKVGKTNSITNNKDKTIVVNNIQRVLVVDDNKLNLKVAKKALEELGYIVDEANSGAECLEKCQLVGYDLIFMDIMMPEMDGVETFEKLKSQDNFTIPVIALTADATSGAEEKYKSKGFSEYIAKPFTKQELEKKILNLLMQ